MPFGPKVTLISIIITGDMKDLIAWEKIALEDGRIRQVLFDGPGTFFFRLFFYAFSLRERWGCS